MKCLSFKHLVLMMVLLSPNLVQAQTEICGVKFGAAFEVAQSILDQKFGKGYVSSNKNVLIYNDVRYAGVSWDKVSFEFQRDGSSSYCISCQMMLACGDLRLAKEARDGLRDKLAKKYDLKEEVDANGLMGYKGGVSPTDEREYGFRLTIVKNINRHLDVLAAVLHDIYGEPLIDLYAVVLTYGPYSYIEEEL